MTTFLKVISSGSMLGIIDDIIDGILAALVYPIIWPLCDIFFLILDMFETLYRKFSGLEPVTLGGVTSTGDPVLFLINSNVVQEMFFSILILSFMLLVIFTIFAIVKNIYTDKPKPVSEIINRSVKALLMYLLVPVATIVCLLVGNVVLVAIDGATKIGGASTTSDMLFLAASYNANKIRAEEDIDGKEEALGSMLGVLIHDLYPDPELANTSQYKQYVAVMARNGVDVIHHTKSGTASSRNWDEIASAIDEAYLSDLFGGGKWLYFNIMPYYRLLNISILTIWVGGAFMIFAMGKITWGLLSRLVKMTMFFALSPALMAMFPIDEGKALGAWRGEMVKLGTMAYCSIGTLNILYSILPAFGQIEFFDFALLNALARLFIYIIAFTSAEKLVGTVSGWFGTGDAVAEGAAAKSGVKNNALKEAGQKASAFGKKATGVMGAYMGGRKEAKDQGKGKWDTFVGGLQGAFSQTGLAKARQETQKAYQDGKKGGAEFYENVKTKNWAGEDKVKYETLTDAHGNVLRDAYGKKLTKEHNLADEYKGQQIIAKESKAIEGKLKDLKDQRAIELASAGGDIRKINAINKKYDEQEQSVKSSAPFVQAVHATEKAVLESQKELQRSQEELFKPLANLRATQSADADLRKRFQKNAGISSLTEEDWEKIKMGDFSSTSGLTAGEKSRAQDAYSVFADQIAGIEERRTQAKQDIQNKYNTSDDAKEYYKELFGTGFTGAINDLSAGIRSIIDREKNAIESSASDLEAATKKLKSDMGNTYDNRDKLSESKLSTIAKNSSNK